MQKRLVARYATKSAEAADENQRRVEAVFAELAGAKSFTEEALLAAITKIELGNVESDYECAPGASRQRP